MTQPKPLTLQERLNEVRENLPMLAELPEAALNMNEQELRRIVNILVVTSFQYGTSLEVLLLKEIDRQAKSN